MIFTKEPANVFYVYLTAYRSHESEEVNLKMLKGMIERIQRLSVGYGNVVDTNLLGCYREDGSEEATIERTIKVEAYRQQQVDNLASLACDVYYQDTVLVVKSQTHEASLLRFAREGIHGVFTRTETPLGGTMQMVQKVSGECYTIDGNQNIWEVI